MRYNNVAKAVVSAVMITAFTLASTPSFAADAGQPAAKPLTAYQVCRQKFTDRKSKDYKTCIRAARKAAKEKKK